MIRKIFAATAMVTIGTLSIKLSMFALNASFLKFSDEGSSIEFAKSIAYGFSLAGLLYFCSVRFVAKLIILDEQEKARFALRASAAIIPVSTAAIAAFLYLLDESLKVIALTLIFSFSYSYFDFVVGLANAVGKNFVATASQIILGTAISVCAISLCLVNQTSLLITLLIPLVALSVSLPCLVLLDKGLRKNLSFVSPFTNIAELAKFSLPTAIATVTMNPLVLWSTDYIAGVHGNDFLIFMVCQNLLGLAMLIPGQINAAVFSIMVTNKLNWIYLLMISCIAAFVSCLLVFAFLPIFGFVYGSSFSAISNAATGFVLAAIPYSLHQFFATRLFLNNQPWLETSANTVFSLSFVLGCYIMYYEKHSLPFLGLITFICYTLRLITLLTLAEVVKK